VFPVWSCGKKDFYEGECAREFVVSNFLVVF
jgi:hypothetical protein